MKNYLNLINHILENGEERKDRTGTGTISVFSSELTFDLRRGLPVTTTKAFSLKSCVGELLWFLYGGTSLKTLKYFTFGNPNSDKWTIWTPNYEDQGKKLGYTDGYLGPVYGHQWRNWGSDQIQTLIDGLINNPYSRRHLVSAWNVEELDKMALPPCHYAFQCYVSNDGYLDLKWNQRSVDVFLGLPFNIVSYAILTHILAQICDLKPRFLYFSGGDTHIYKDHLEQVKTQVTREPRQPPMLVLPDFYCLEDLLSRYTAKDFSLIGYDPYPAIKGKMSS